MRRIYITAVPLQSNFVLDKQEAIPENFTLKGEMKPAAFPIIPIIENTVQEGDEVKVIAVRQKNDDQNANFEILKYELNELKLSNVELVDLVTPECQDKDELLVLYEQLIDQIEDDACYYACATFGTKTYPLVLFSALRAADRLYQSTDIKGIYYRQVRRINGIARDYRVYDISALFTIDSIVDLVSNEDVKNPKEFIHVLLHPEVSED